MIDKLVNEILRWWKNHEYDVDIVDNDGCEEEFNRYDEEPTFVKLAKEFTNSQQSEEVKEK